jgi:hypothetical protein
MKEEDEVEEQQRQRRQTFAPFFEADCKDLEDVESISWFQGFMFSVSLLSFVSSQRIQSFKHGFRNKNDFDFTYGHSKFPHTPARGFQTK